MDTNQDLSICCLQETQLRTRNTYRLNVRSWKNILHANGNQKIAGVAILIIGKLCFKIKTTTRDKEGHCLMSKVLIQEGMTIINIYIYSI